MVKDVVDNTIERLLRGELSVYEISDKRCKLVLIRLLKKIRKK